MRKALLIFILLLPACTPYDPDGKLGNGKGNSPFPQENTPYTLAFIIDPKCCDRLVGGDGSGLKYAMDVKDIFFRDRTEPNDRLIIALVSGKDSGVVWDGDRKSTRLNSSHIQKSRMPSSA